MTIRFSFYQFTVIFFLQSSMPDYLVLWNRFPTRPCFNFLLVFLPHHQFQLPRLAHHFLLMLSGFCSDDGGHGGHRSPARVLVLRDRRFEHPEKSRWLSSCLVSLTSFGIPRVQLIRLSGSPRLWRLFVTSSCPSASRTRTCTWRSLPLNSVVLPTGMPTRLGSSSSYSRPPSSICPASTLFILCLLSPQRFVSKIVHM